MQTVYDREVTLHSRNAQGRNALTERAGRAAVFYKPAHARKTQPGAWRRLAAVALCCGALLCAFRLYGRARSRFGVQLPVRTVLQNPELPNGCEAASLAALLKYRQHRTIAEASAVESPIRQETIGFPAHFFARAHNFKPPGRACQPEADSPMRT